MSVLSCIPQMLVESPGLPIAGCWACLHKVRFLLYSQERHLFPPHFHLPTVAEGAGNFTRAPSHHQPNPTSPGSPGMRVMAPAWLWLQIFTAAPARAHLPCGPATRLGHGLAPGSMKARVVRRSAGAGRIQIGCGTSFHLPSQHRAAEPLPKTPRLIFGCQLQGCIAQ